MNIILLLSFIYIPGLITLVIECIRYSNEYIVIKQGVIKELTKLVSEIIFVSLMNYTLIYIAFYFIFNFRFSNYT